MTRTQTGSSARRVADVAAFRERLISWWLAHGRDFPWRHTRDPYRVLVAEVLLHRTKASQVVPLYLEFTRRFRSWEDVTRASLPPLRRLLQPLGLNWRIDELYHMAKEIVKQFGGRTPRATDELESLPGVGHYKAAAVRCFAYGESEVLLDTNTVRVLSRVRGLKRTDASRRSRLYREEMARLLDPMHPREFNLALLDLAALVCLPSDPDCPICPVLDHCIYGRRRLHRAVQEQ
jgi:A/G-specific adenine glycosylase